MFTENNDIIDIFIYFKKKKHGYVVFSRNDFLKLNEEEKLKYSIINIKMRVLNWGFYNTLQEINIENGFKEYKEAKLKNLIIEWNVKDSNGILKKIPLSEDAIMQLHPEIAECILNEYDSVSFISDDDEKKITRSVYAYVMGKGKSTSAVTRAIIENDLIDEYHWLPQDVAKIPYRKLQEFFLVRREKNNARNAKVAVNKFKQEIDSSAQRGQSRRR